MELEKLIRELSSINVMSAIRKDDGKSTLISTVEGCNIEFKDTGIREDNDNIEVLSLLSKMYVSNDLEVMREIVTEGLGLKTFNSQNKPIEELKNDIMETIKNYYSKTKHLVKLKEGEENGNN